MDWRVKTFEAQAAEAFAFLLDHGFDAAVDYPSDVDRRPATVAVRFVSPGMSVETALSLGFAGEDGIRTTVLTSEGSSEFGPAVAHKGHDMRKALRTQAAQVRTLLDRG